MNRVQTSERVGDPHSLDVYLWSVVVYFDRGSHTLAQLNTSLDPHKVSAKYESKGAAVRTHKKRHFTISGRVSVAAEDKGAKEDLETMVNLFH